VLMLMKTKDELEKDEKYRRTDMYAENFLPHGKYKKDNGDIIELMDNDLHIEFNGKMRQLIAVYDAKGILDACPICDAPSEDGSFVVMTDTHMLYPCWGCDKLIERERNEDIRKEDYV